MQGRIRAFLPNDAAEICALYQAAVPFEDLCPLITALHGCKGQVVSWVYEQSGSLAGHVLATRACVAGACVAGASVAGHSAQLFLLGPLAVHPLHQKGGIGSALMRYVLADLCKQGADKILVLGDPAFYGRFGFGCERHIRPPFPIPDEWQTAWQSLDWAGDGADHGPISGPLQLPPPWMVPALWRE